MTSSSGRTALARRIVGVLAALFVFGTVAGCGGRQAPPSEGTCHAWRRWVPPHEENGETVEGHCEDR